jgi:uncharacterized protein YukE
MQYTEEQEKALKDLNSAMDALRRASGGKAGESAEKKYGEAYKKCYQLGIKQYPLIVGRTTR